MAALIVAAGFVIGLVIGNRFLRRREREGDWDKEGHGTPEHQDPGVKFRPLEAPGQAPFD